MGNKVNKETAKKLEQYIEAIEQKEQEKQESQAQIKEMFDGAKSEGFDIKAMKTIIKIRKLDKATLEMDEHMVEMYKDALGLNQ